jgi:uncharacterized protein involved in exopolysaccharide biosynthesis
MANPYEMTTREILSILFKEWRKLAVVFIALVVVVTGFSFLLTPYYEATTRLLVKSGREFQVRSDPNQPVVSIPASTKQEIVNSEIQILTSRDIIEGAISRVGINKLYPGIEGGSLLGSGVSPMDKAVQQFQRDLKVTPVELADVIEVSYRNPDPEVAVAALNAVIDLYQQKHAAMFADPKFKLLGEQTEQYTNQLDAVTRKITDMRNSGSLFDIPTQRGKLLDDRASISTILEQLRSQSVDVHRRMEFLQARLRATAVLVPAGQSQADVVEQAKARLLDTQVKAEELRQRYTDPNIKPLRDAAQQIADLKQFISGPAAGQKQWSQRNPAYDDMAVALDRALADAAPLDQQIALRTQQVAAIDGQLRNLETGAKSLEDAERDRRTLEELVHTYRTEYEQAKLNQDLDQKNLISVSVLQKPAASSSTAGPHHLPFALAGILLGLIGASGMLIYLLVFRETLITVESVERIIGVPVLASVPNSRMANDNRQAA